MNEFYTFINHNENVIKKMTQVGMIFGIFGTLVGV